MPTSTVVAYGLATTDRTRHDSSKRHSMTLHDKNALRRNDSPMSRKSDLHRSASYTYISNGQGTPLTYVPTGETSPTIHSSFSEQDLLFHSDRHDASALPSEDVSPSSDEHDEHTYMATLSERPRPQTPDITASSTHKTPEYSARAPSNSRQSFARRLSRRLTPHSSRSPSPIKESPLGERPASPHSNLGSKGRSLLARRSSARLDASSIEPSPATTPTKRTLHRTRSFIASTLSLDERSKLSDRPSMLGKSFSVDRLTHLADSKRHTLVGGPVPTVDFAVYNTNSSTLSLNRKRDELWTVFRQLESDFTKFNAKSSSLKANVVRQCLLPFLRNYKKHPSSDSLRPEDLDRRTSILNKWWLGMLDMLNGKHNQSVSGTDRPAILEGLSGIMDRFEWRYFQPSSSSSALQRPTHPHSVLSGHSSASLTSTGSDSLMECVQNTIRSMFVHNLQTQMTFVVDKMSLRSASASLVTFCGKAIAFAFFYCQQIAEVLVRAWGISADTIKRVLGEYGISGYDRCPDESSSLRMSFPPPMRNLAFTSLANTIRHLRAPARLPSGMHLNWYGHWLSRWRGKESDLFFTFTKNYYMLAADYLPADAGRNAVICAPAMLLVQSQLLATLDSTIHRAGVGIVGSPPHNASDDVISEPDIAATLALPPANVHRIMAENRLVMLTREMLHEKSSDDSLARSLYAVAFNDVLQACARRISVFDHAACYTLCDFLEEALLILVRYENMVPEQRSIINSAFWYDVCKRMLASRNTVTEIRLFTFLYAIWNHVCPNGPSKMELCEQLVLCEDVFFDMFLHWCPMVRAYYMRLLCWRVGRFDGETVDSSSSVLEMLLGRLHTVWCWYMHEKSKSDTDDNYSQISALPCDPAPGRRLIIIRTDSDPVRHGPSFGFDGMLSPVTRAPPLITPYATTTASPDNAFTPPVLAPNGDLEAESPRGREAGLRGFLRGIIGPGKKATPIDNDAVPLPTSLSESSVSSVSGAALVHDSSDEDGTTARTRPTPRVCFKFLLDSNHRIASAGTGQERPLECPRLPYLAQRHVEQRTGCDMKSAVGCPIPVDMKNINPRYLGRAIAEWTNVVGECQSFIARRRADGVTEEKMIETPTLSVEVGRR